MGKVNRIYQSRVADSAGSRRKRLREHREFSAPYKFKWNPTWIATLTLLGLVVLIVGSVLFSWLAREGRRQTANAANNHTGVINPAESAANEPPSEESALALVKQAMAVGDAAGVELYLRHRQSSPDAVVDFLTNLNAVNGGTYDLKWLGNTDIAGKPVAGVAVTYAVNDMLFKRLALVTECASQVWKIDFEAFARPIEPPMEQLADGSSAETQAYVLIEREYYPYHNGPFADDARWACFGLFLPDREERMFGYCQRGSTENMAIERLLETDGDLLKIPGLARAVVRIRRHEGSSQRQFEIVRVVANDWLLSEADHEGQGR